jgi:hypothetical protein
MYEWDGEQSRVKKNLATIVICVPEGSCFEYQNVV